MIQKYITNDTVNLVSSVVYAEKDNYTYEWYVDSDLISTEYSTTYKFKYNGSFVIKLVVTDISNGYKTNTITTVVVTIKSQKKIP